jgi:large subunit ribosomal protein L16
MMQPKKTKYRKQQKCARRIKQKTSRGAKIEFGQYALQALEGGWIPSRRIEAARRTISRYVKKSGKLWIRIYPDKPISKKPAETRMGSGKGGVEYWVAEIQPGRVIFEITGVDVPTAREAFDLAAAKLGVKTRMVVRTDTLL